MLLALDNFWIDKIINENNKWYDITKYTTVAKSLKTHLYNDTKSKYKWMWTHLENKVNKSHDKWYTQ